MPDHGHWPRGPMFLAALVVGWMALAQTAQAHRLKVFATAEGKTISGSVYFAGGGVAKHMSVTVIGPHEHRLGETETDEEGRFTFEARYRCDHTFAVTTADAHRTAYTVRADELPDDLPPLNGEAEEGPTVEPVTPAPVSVRDVAGLEPVPHQGLAEMVERAVSKQVGPLREDLNAYAEKVRFRDVLGGIGYIFGVMGLVFFLKGRRGKGRE